MIRESTVASISTFADWTARRKAGVAVTGATGWVGSALAHRVLDASSEHAPAVRLFGAAAREMRLGAHMVRIERLADAAPLGDGEWLVVHLAVAGADRLGDNPSRLMAANDALLDDALALAATGETRRFVYASSGAVYRDTGSAETRAYAEMKRAQERRVGDWGASTSTPILIPRIFNVGGPYITHPQRYALGSFIRQALATGVIDVEARRRVLRSYVHVAELARVVLDLAVGQEAFLSFDTAGEQVVEMADLAAAVARVLDRPVEVRRPPMEPGEDRYVGDGAIYRAAAARSRSGPLGLDRIVRDTIAYLRAMTPS